MADAVKQLFPASKLAIGPAIEDGFYYDFDTEKPFFQDDLIKIEQKMAEIIKENLPFERTEYSHQKAEDVMKDEPYKIELIRELPDDKVTFYKHGDFIDMCRGPHIERTGLVKHYKLLSATGAYWRGSEKNKMLQRIYGTAFFTKEELDAFLAHREEVKKRDHRILGEDLDLFSIHQEEAGPGLIYWHPKGATIRQLIEDFWKSEHRKSGYQFIYSPHIAKINLWKTSGHWDFYKEYMFSPMDIEGQNYILKPMNCPGHILVYKTRVRSYRDLPLRWAELGTVYRYERSGVIQGLLRVRGFTQDDAHIFCRIDQLHKEIMDVIKLAIHIFRSFGFSDFKIRLSTRPAHYVGTIERWDMATDALRQAVESLNIPYETAQGEAVFYGPKADIDIRDCLGRAWQCFTVQVDFNLPERFDLYYSAKDGTRHRPIMLHRALMGSLERFFAILIEHYAGAFPSWLAPTQAIILPVTPEQIEYAKKTYSELLSKGIRAEIDSRDERLSERIKDASLSKCPYILVVGEKEEKEQTIALRQRAKKDITTISLDDFIKLIKQENNPKD
jgi:threonyl-tRNA synthetase